MGSCGVTGSKHQPIILVVQVLETDLVAARREDPSIGQQTFHRYDAYHHEVLALGLCFFVGTFHDISRQCFRWLTLARLLSASYGESALTKERWEFVRKLDHTCEERVRAL